MILEVQGKAMLRFWPREVVRHLNCMGRVRPRLLRAGRNTIHRTDLMIALLIIEAGFIPRTYWLTR